MSDVPLLVAVETKTKTFNTNTDIQHDDMLTAHTLLGTRATIRGIQQTL